MGVLRLNQKYNHAKITDQNNSKYCGGAATHILLCYM